MLTNQLSNRTKDSSVKALGESVFETKGLGAVFQNAAFDIVAGWNRENIFDKIRSLIRD